MALRGCAPLCEPMRSRMNASASPSRAPCRASLCVKPSAVSSADGRACAQVVTWEKGNLSEFFTALWLHSSCAELLISIALEVPPYPYPCGIDNVPRGIQRCRMLRSVMPCAAALGRTGIGGGCVAQFEAREISAAERLIRSVLGLEVRLHAEHFAQVAPPIATRVCGGACVRASVRACVRACASACARVRVCLSLCVCVYACVCARARAFCVRVHVLFAVEGGGEGGGGEAEPEPERTASCAILPRMTACGRTHVHKQTNR